MGGVKRGLLSDLRRKSNCVIEAVRLLRAMTRAIREAGFLDADGKFVPGHEPYVWARPSRAKNGVMHCGVGVLNHHTDELTLLSFKPVAPVDVPWWKVLSRLRFEGHYRLGDYPDTKVESAPPRINE
jgi:hypothetical protein